MPGETKRFQPDDDIVAQGESDHFTYVLLTGKDEFLDPMDLVDLV